MKNKIICLSVLVLAVLALASCVTPSPLYGTWYTSSGDKIVLSTEGQFKSEISDGAEIETLFGSWKSDENLILFTIKDPSTGTYMGTRISQFEINGGKLIMNWTCDEVGNGRYLTFYRTSTDAIILN